MAESVDAADLKSAGRKTVGVQVSLPPSRKRLAAAGLTVAQAAFRFDPPAGLRVGRAAPPILRGLRVVFNISGNNYRLALQESISRGKKRP